METVMLILLLLTALFSLLAVIFSAKAAGKKQEDQNQAVHAKLDALSASLSSEMSNNRRETYQQLSDMSRRISEMSEKNLAGQQAMTEAVNKTLTEIRLSNEKKLEEMRLTVDEKLNTTLTARLDSSFKTVSGQLEKLYVSLGEMKELSGGITANVTSLNRVLTNVKARGTWAEYQLEAILDQTIPNRYVKNYRPSGQRDFIEFAVTLPAGEDGRQTLYLPIDSKFPMEDYARLCAAADSADAEAVAEARKALEKRVLEEARAASKYIQVPETTPFAIMYLATEGLYAEIAASKTGLFEKIQNEYNVLVAGPTTVTALLNSFAMGFRTIAVNEKANEIKQLLGAIKKQYELFDTVLQKVKRKLSEADAQLDDATKRNDIIQKKLRAIDAADATDAEKILGIQKKETNPFLNN